MRVDILERLADLIRPALAWREGALGAKAAGAVAGGGFTVVNTMTSLTGASGEDFASILRSLGYRLERRPKPAEPVERRQLASAAEIASQQSVRPPVETDGSDLHATAEAATAAAAARSRTAAELQLAPRMPRSPALPKCRLAADCVVEAVTASARARRSAPASRRARRRRASGRSAAVMAEPEMIEVWRPGRSEGRRRPHDKHREPAGSSENAGTGTHHARPRRAPERLQPLPRQTRCSAGRADHGRQAVASGLRRAGTPFAPSPPAWRRSSGSTVRAVNESGRPQRGAARAARATRTPREGARSEFAFRQARGAEGSARGGSQGAPLAHDRKSGGRFSEKTLLHEHERVPVEQPR